MNTATFEALTDPINELAKLCSHIAEVFHCSDRLVAQVICDIQADVRYAEIVTEYPTVDRIVASYAKAHRARYEAWQVADDARPRYSLHAAL